MTWVKIPMQKRQQTGWLQDLIWTWIPRSLSGPMSVKCREKEMAFLNNPCFEEVLGYVNPRSTNADWSKIGVAWLLTGIIFENLPVNSPPATVSESKPNGQSEPPRLWPSFTDPLEVFLNSTLKIGDFPFPTSHFQQFMGTCSPVPH